MDDLNDRDPLPLPDPRSGEDTPILRALSDDVVVEHLEDEALLALVEERLTLSKRRVVAGTVRIATRTEVREELTEAELDRYRIEVTRVPVDRVVEVAPGARVEGDTTIIPIVEERLVMVKQLVITEELHIRHVVDRELVRQAVTLRRQHLTVERHPGDSGTPGQTS